MSSSSVRPGDATKPILEIKTCLNPQQSGVRPIWTSRRWTSKMARVLTKLNHGDSRKRFFKEEDTDHERHQQMLNWASDCIQDPFAFQDQQCPGCGVECMLCIEAQGDKLRVKAPDKHVHQSFFFSDSWRSRIKSR